MTNETKNHATLADTFLRYYVPLLVGAVLIMFVIRYSAEANELYVRVTGGENASSYDQHWATFRSLLDQALIGMAALLVLGFCSIYNGLSRKPDWSPANYQLSLQAGGLASLMAGLTLYIPFFIGQMAWCLMNFGQEYTDSPSTWYAVKEIVAEPSTMVSMLIISALVIGLVVLLKKVDLKSTTIVPQPEPAAGQLDVGYERESLSSKFLGLRRPGRIDKMRTAIIAILGSIVAGSIGYVAVFFYGWHVF